jgi:hypothetical protein
MISQMVAMIIKQVSLLNEQLDDTNQPLGKVEPKYIFKKIVLLYFSLFHYKK